MKLKFPSISVTVPADFFSIDMTPAPITGSPFGSVTFPVSLVPCAAAVRPARRNKARLTKCAVAFIIKTLIPLFGNIPIP